MLTVYKLGEDRYLLVRNTNEFEGNGAQTIARMLLMKVEKEEVYAGMVALIDDDQAVYGIFRTFMYSKKIDKKSA